MCFHGTCVGCYGIKVHCWRSEEFIEGFLYWYGFWIRSDRCIYDGILWKSHKLYADKRIMANLISTLWKYNGEPRIEAVFCAICSVTRLWWELESMYSQTIPLPCKYNTCLNKPSKCVVSGMLTNLWFYCFLVHKWVSL